MVLNVNIGGKYKEEKKNGAWVIEFLLKEKLSMCIISVFFCNIPELNFKMVKFANY